MLQEVGVDYQHDVTARPWSETAKIYHPMGKVPSLSVNDGAFRLYESTAINTFLGDVHQRTDLVPSDVYQRAKYNQTVSFISTELDAQALWIHRKHHGRLAKVFGDVPEAVAAAKQQFETANRSLLKNDPPHPFLLGSNFTAADILYVHCLDWAAAIGWNDDWAGQTCSDTARTVQDYLFRCKSRPAYQETVAKRQAEKEAHRRASKL
jgi:glutathione S-transferase